MDYLIAILVIATIGPLFAALTLATLVAIPVGLSRFDVKAGNFGPGTGEVLSRIYTIATVLGFLTTGVLLIAGLLAILFK